jgi:hypothetical protein
MLIPPVAAAVSTVMKNVRSGLRRVLLMNTKREATANITPGAEGIVKQKQC